MPLMPFQCWPFGRDYVQGWIGGGTAWDLARAGEAAAIDYALGQLRELFGGRVDRLFAGGGSLVTHWDADPWIRGAYCYARAGSVPGARSAGDAIGGRAPDVRRRGLQRPLCRHPGGRLDQRPGGGEGGGGDRLSLARSTANSAASPFSATGRRPAVCDLARPLAPDREPGHA